MKKFMRCATLFGAVLVPTAQEAGEVAQATVKPNIVFLLADQWRAKAIGYEGDPNVKTPNLDRLARQSLNFRNVVSVCPVCTPYRARADDRPLSDVDRHVPERRVPAGRELCFAEIFKQAGYGTAYIGKWHLDGHGRSSFVAPQRRQGWDYWKAAECDHDYPHSHFYEGDSDEKRFWDGYDAFAQTRDAQTYLRQHAQDDRPFVLMVSYGIPHFPHQTALQEYKTCIRRRRSSCRRTCRRSCRRKPAEKLKATTPTARPWTSASATCWPRSKRRSWRNGRSWCSRPTTARCWARTAGRPT